MKRTSILSASIIILLILFPLIVNARDMGFTYKHQFQPMSEKQIRTQIALLDLENFGSGVLAVGGLVAAGTGTISFIIGLEMFFSEPIIEWEPSHDFNPFFIIPFMQYAVGAILLIGPPGYCKQKRLLRTKDQKGKREKRPADLPPCTFSLITATKNAPGITYPRGVACLMNRCQLPSILSTCMQYPNMPG